MKSIKWAAVALAAMVLGNESNAESAQEILDAAWAAQLSRWEGLDSYLVEESVMGRTSKRYFVRTAMADSAGNLRTLFLPAADAGLEPGCVNATSLTQVPAGKGDHSAEHLMWFLDNAELVGEESIDGRDTWQLSANDVNRSQAMGSEDATINSMTMWLSKGDYLPVKMRMEGETMVEGQSRPVVIETLSSDFRTVTGSRLQEPFRRVVNISGMMTGMDAEELAQVKAQMAEMEKQLASMPPSQREMMKNMMGPQLDTLRRLGETGGIETEILVESITANPEAFGERIAACSGS